jgi:hypothetical protein
MYDLVSSPIRFKDPESGKITRIGELCLKDSDRDLLHIDHLPARRLKPIKQHLKGVETEVTR